MNTFKWTIGAMLCIAGTNAMAGDRRSNPEPPMPPDSAASPDVEADSPLYYVTLTGRNSGDIDMSGMPLVDGDVVVIYQHNFGLYPYINHRTGDHANGSVPQRANIPAHLRQLEIDMDRYIPDPEWDGYAVLDYEEWRPNWEGNARRYKEMSRQLVRENNPGLDDAQVERRAKIQLEREGKRFLKKTLEKCHELRPNAKWGMWSYPRGGMDVYDARWLWELTDAFYPDVYMKYSHKPDGAELELGEEHVSWFVENRLIGRVAQAREIAGDKPVLAFMWPRYRGSNPNQWLRYKQLSDSDMALSLEGPLEYGADAVVVWESVPQPGLVDRIQELLEMRVVPEVSRIMADRGMANPNAGEGSDVAQSEEEPDTDSNGGGEYAEADDDKPEEDEPTTATRRASRRVFTRFSRQSRGGSGG